MSHAHRKETVLVTGGSDYVAGWIIVGLLREGYKVRATLRNLQRQADVRAAVAPHTSHDGRCSSK